MKKLFTFLCLTYASTAALAQNNIGINTSTPDASAALDVTSTSQGVLIPRLSKAQRDGINLINGVSMPATGLLIYQTDQTPGFYFYNGSAWTSLNGPSGGNNQVIPVGGTAGQVLSKVDGINYNTQWATLPASTSIPSQNGNSGKYLQTDGSNLNWGSAPVSTYPNVELSISNNASQNISSLASTTSLTTLVFNGSNHSNASLTGGNRWDGSVFTVGTAGWYQFSVQVKGVNNTGGETTVGLAYFMDINNSGVPLFLSTYDLNSNSPQVALRNSSKINCIVYLSTNSSIRFKGQSWSNSTAFNSSTDGSTNLCIIRLK